MPPTAIAVPPPTGSVTRVMLSPDADRDGRDGAEILVGLDVWVFYIVLKELTSYANISGRTRGLD